MFVLKFKNMDNIKSFKSKIENAASIAIFTHVNPDGDTLGAALALKIVIKEYFRKEVVLIINGKVPDIYKFLPCVDEIIPNLQLKKDKKFDLAIAVDIAAIDRMSYSLPWFESADFKINIDHHVTNCCYGDLNFVRGDVSSAGEVLFGILKKAEIPITKDVAVCLYASICSDTGNFKYENTTPQVLKIAGELAELGAVPSEVSRFIYGMKPKEMVMLGAYAVNNAVFECGGRVAYSVIRLDDIKKFNALNEYTEGIVETLREIFSVELSILFKEINGEQTKVSMRSKNIDSTLITGKFDGGGHRFASGCTINRPLRIAVDKVVGELKKYF